MQDTQQNLVDTRMAAIAKAPGHPARLRILRLLARTPGCIGGNIAEAVGLAQSTASEHLRILKDADVIERQIDPPRVFYSLSLGALRPLSALIAELDVARHEVVCRVTPAPTQG